MKYYAFIKDDKINGVGQCECLSALNIEITEEVYNGIISDKLLYIWDGEDIILNPNYEEEKAKERRLELDALYMTRSDFFDGFILAFDLGQVELRAIVEQILQSINIKDVEIKVALNNFDNALNFYRKHTLFTLINGVNIPISETVYLLFTSDIWDKFFDTKDYKELQKAIHEIEPESDTETDTEAK